MKIKAMFIVGLLLMSVFVSLCMPYASAANKNYLKVDETYGGVMNNRYVNNGNSFNLGDKDIFFSIAVQNVQWDIGHWNEYNIQNVTAKISGQKDMNGASATILDFANGENTGEYLIKDGHGPILGGSAVISGYQADVVATGAAGTYNLTVDLNYDYSYMAANSSIQWTKGTDQDYVYIRIDDGLNVNQGVNIFDENNVIVGHYLYAGTNFQKVGVYVQTAVGKIGEVTATITLDTQTKSYLTLDQQGAYTSQLNGGTSVYFKYRVDVKDGTPPGRYSATMVVQYLRWYGETNQKQITAQQIPLEFIVDFTPLLTITSPASFTVTQGALTTNLTDVTLKNIGNTELKKIKVWIDISNYFEENGFYYYGDGGARVLIPTQDQKETLGVGETWQIDFLGINVFKYLPAGEHRLPLQYSGYYADDGTAGGSSDYKLTDASVYYAIKQETLYVKVNVQDSTHDFKVQSTSSVNLGQRMDDVTVSLSIQNLEDVDVLYTSVMVGTKDQTGAKPLFINPKNTGSDYLDPIELTRFPAQSTQYFNVNADVSLNATAGYYNLPVLITGVNANTKGPVSVTRTMSIRVNPEPPKLLITDLTYDAKTIKGGKEFTLTINVKNVGKDVARNIFVTLVEGNNGGAGISTNFAPDVAKADAIANPFSVKVSKILVDGSIAPGDTKSVTYTVKADKNLVKGKDYQMNVYVEYNDDLSRSWSYSSEVSISVSGSIPTQPQDNSGMMNITYAAILALIFIIILMFVWVKMTKPKRPSRYDEALPSEPAPREHTPPSTSSAPATATAAPVQTTTVMTPTGAQTFKVCPACHKSVPASMVTCTHCGCAL
jgi:hypothetical protein